MEFAFCLRYGTPSTMPLCTHSTMSATRTTKLSFSSSHSSLLLSSFSKCRRLRHVFSPVACVGNEPALPSTDGKDYNKRGSRTGDTMVPMETDALKSFIDVFKCLASSNGPTVKLLVSNPSKGPSPEDVHKFKMELFRSVEANEAIKQLRDVYEIHKDKPEPAFNLEMALVEIYIYTGRYEEALECNCLKHDHSHMSDKRITLYKAIAHNMLAKQFWEEYTTGGIPDISLLNKH